MVKIKEYTQLAWEGWQAEIPADWRPLKIEKKLGCGTMVVGDSDQAIFQIKWWQPEKKNFDFISWLKYRKQKVAPAYAQSNQSPKHKDSIDASAWFPKENMPHGVKSFWYGYSKAGDLVLEIVINGMLEKKIENIAISKVLPSIDISREDEPIKWSFFDVSFETPAGYKLFDKRLNVGDMSIMLKDDKSRIIHLRQIYPGSLALSRRKLDRWMIDKKSFKGRVYTTINPAKETELETSSKKTIGIIEKGKWAVRFPLNFIARTFSYSAAVNDEELDRLLIVRFDSPKDEGSDMVYEMISKMNRS